MHADTIIASVSSVAAMKEYRADMDKRLVDCGRRPEDCKVLFVVSPVLADTDEEAQAKRERSLGPPEVRIERALSALSFSSGIDFSQFDLDGPYPNFCRSTMLVARPSGYWVSPV